MVILFVSLLSKYGGDWGKMLKESYRKVVCFVGWFKVFFVIEVFEGEFIWIRIMKCFLFLTFLILSM